MVDLYVWGGGGRERRGWEGMGGDGRGRRGVRRGGGAWDA